MRLFSASPPETKVAGAGWAGVLVSAVLGALATWAPGFHAPPPYLVGLFITLIGSAVGYYLPHTWRPGDPPLVTTDRPVMPADPTLGEFQQWARGLGYQATFKSDLAAQGIPPDPAGEQQNPA